MKKIIYLLIAFLISFSLSAQRTKSKQKPKPVIKVTQQPVVKPLRSVFQSTDPFLTPDKYEELSLSSIKPTGWLLQQLRAMRDGSTGHLDEVYDKVKNDNGWLGGAGDGWEETPYWLDGALPLAYLTDDQVLQKKVLQYVNWTIAHQRPSGYFGPVTKTERERGIQVSAAEPEAGEDWWPRMLMLKVMQQYYSATEDKRVIGFLSNYFHYQLQVLEKCPIGKWTEWASSRGTENILVAQWLFRITKDPSLLQLASLIQKQSFQWSKLFGERDLVINAAAQQNSDAWMYRHGVNVGMALKDPVLQYQRTHDTAYLAAIHTGFADLMNLHGLPMGMFSADEDLHGNNPVHGSELCAVVETMFSLEQIIATTGETRYMDALERITFNALPTQTTDDYNYKQYFQIANQVQVAKGVFNFSLPFSRGMTNVYGAKSGYTCCLANMHQGWTKYSSHLWFRAPGNGLAALVYGPNNVTAKVGADNREVTIQETTGYPFEDRINFHFATTSPVSFPFTLRIPAWCKEAVIMVNGQPFRKVKGGELTILDRTWQDKDSVSLQLPMEVSTSNWGNNSRAVERGPLVYALKITSRWEQGKDSTEGTYFSVYPQSDWNFGLVKATVTDPLKNLEVKIIKPVTEKFRWNAEFAPVEIIATAHKIPGWKLNADGVATQPVTTREGIYQGVVDEKLYKVTLIPYGCTTLRVVAFPVVR